MSESDPLCAYVLLYKGTRLHSRLIRWQTFSDYSHAAMVLPMPPLPVPDPAYSVARREEYIASVEAIPAIPVGDVKQLQAFGRYIDLIASPTHTHLLFEAVEGVGVQVRPVSPVHDIGTQVDWRRLDATPEQFQAMRVFAIRQLGKGYDWSSVFRFISRREHNRSSLGKWFCSEYVDETANQGGIDLLARRHSSQVNPGMLDLSPRLPTCEPPVSLGGAAL